MWQACTFSSKLSRRLDFMGNLSCSFSFVIFFLCFFLIFLRSGNGCLERKEGKRYLLLFVMNILSGQVFALYVMKLNFLLYMYPLLYSRLKLIMLVCFSQDLKFWANHEFDCELLLLLNSNWRCVFLLLGLQFCPFSSPEKDRRFRKLPTCKWVEFCVWVFCPSSQPEYSLLCISWMQKELKVVKN